MVMDTIDYCIFLLTAESVSAMLFAILSDVIVLLLLRDNMIVLKGWGPRLLPEMSTS